MEQIKKAIEEGMPYLLMRPVLIFIIGVIAIKIILSLERKTLKSSRLDPVSHVMVVRVTKIALWILLILSILASLDVNMGPYVAVLGAGGAAIALALRDSLANVAGGIILLFTKPFTVGDEVVIDGTKGVVDTIDLMTTRMHTYDNREVIIPNGKVSNTMVINATRRDIRRVDVNVKVAFGQDLALVNKILLDIAEDSPMILKDPPPYVGADEQDADGITVLMDLWCKTEDRFDVRIYMIEEMSKRLSEAGIEMPRARVEISQGN